MNPILAALGYEPHDRVVIVHADDIGMCQASTGILPGLFDGVITAGSMMVPCPWFPAAAAWAAANPAVDLGVHLTLTCEWQQYRWGALTRGASLHDAQGYQPRSMADVFAQVTAADADAEIAAQYARAVQHGMRPTHIDSHMGTMFGPQTLAGYLGLSARERVPAFLVRLRLEQALASGFDEVTARHQETQLAHLASAGVPVCDQMRFLDLGNPQQQLDDVKTLFAELPSGLTYFICHPAADTPELRAIAPDWQARARDLAVMTDPALRVFVEEQGIRLIGWRVIHERMQATR